MDPEAEKMRDEPLPNMGRARPRLSTVQRFELGGASVANAIDLRRDAQVLHDADRMQRAAYLLYACMEELLKAHLCLTDGPADWGDFWATFRDHPRKLALIAEVDPGQPERTAEFVKVLTYWRERCLYVEVSQRGDPLTPRGLVNPGGLDDASIAIFMRWTDEQIPRFIARLQELEPTMRGEGNSPSATSTQVVYEITASSLGLIAQLAATSSPATSFVVSSSSPSTIAIRAFVNSSTLM